MTSKSSLYCGQTFKNFAEFNKVFQSHCKEFGQKYNECGFPIQEINFMIKDRSLLFRSDFVFSSVTYKCVQNASRIPFLWSSEVPQLSQIAKVTCSAGLTLTAIHSKDVMEITFLDLNHNHPSDMHQSKDLNVGKQGHPPLTHFVDLPNKSEANKRMTADVVIGDTHTDRTNGFKTNIPIKEEEDYQSFAQSLSEPYTERNHLLVKEEVQELSNDCALPVQNECLNNSGTRDKQDMISDVINNGKKTGGKMKMQKRAAKEVAKVDYCGKFTKLLPKPSSNLVCSKNNEQHQSMNCPRLEKVFFTKHSVLTTAPANAILPSSSVTPCNNNLYPNLNMALQVQFPHVASPNILPIDSSTCQFAPFVAEGGSFKLPHQPSLMGPNTLPPLVTPLLNTGTMINPSQALCSLAPPLLTVPRPHTASTDSPSKDIYTSLVAPGQNINTGQVNTGIMISTSPNTSPIMPQALFAATSPNVSVMSSSLAAQTSVVTPGRSLNISQDTFFTMEQAVNAGQTEVDGIKIQNSVPLMPGTVPNLFSEMQTFATPVSENLFPVVLGNQVVFMKQPVLTSSGLSIVSSSLPLTSLSLSSLATSSSISNASGQTCTTCSVVTSSPPRPPLLLAAPVRFQNPQVMPVLSAMSLSSPVTLTSSRHAAPLPASHAETSLRSIASKAKEKNVIPRTPLPAKNAVNTWWMKKEHIRRGRRKLSEKMRIGTVRSEVQMEKCSGLEEKRKLPTVKRNSAFALSKGKTTIGAEKVEENEIEQSASGDIQSKAILPPKLTKSIHPTAVVSTVNLPFQQDTASVLPHEAPEYLSGHVSLSCDSKNSTNSSISGKVRSQNNIKQSLPEKQPPFMASSELSQCPQLLGPLPSVWGNHATPQLPSSSSMEINNILSNNVPILPKGSELKNAASVLSCQKIDKKQSKNVDKMEVCSRSAEGHSKGVERVTIPSKLKESSEMKNEESTMFIGPFSRDQFNNIISDPECLKNYVAGDILPDNLEIGSRVLALPVQLNSSVLQQEKGFDRSTGFALKEPGIVEKNDLVRNIEKYIAVSSSPVPIFSSTCISSTHSPRVIKPKISTTGEQTTSAHCETLQAVIHKEDETVPKDYCDITDQAMSLEEKTISSKSRGYKLFKPHKKFISQKKQDKINKQEKTFQFCMSENLSSIGETEYSNQCPQSAPLKLSFCGDISLLHKSLQKCSVNLEKLPVSSLSEYVVGCQMDNAKTDSCHTSKFQTKHKRKYTGAFLSNLSHNICPDSVNNENSYPSSQLESIKDCRKRKKRLRKTGWKWVFVKAGDSVTDTEELGLTDSEIIPIQRKSNRISSKPKLDYSTFETKAFIDLDFESGQDCPLEIPLEAEGSGADEERHTKSFLEEANCGSGKKGVSRERQRTNKPHEKKTHLKMFSKKSETLISPARKGTDNINKTLDSSSSKSDVSKSSCSLKICTDSSLSNHSLSIESTDMDCNNSSIKLEEDMEIVDFINSKITEPQEGGSVHYSSESDSDMFTDEQKHLTMKEKMKVIRRHINDVTLFFIRYTHLFDTVQEYKKSSYENDERYLCKVCKAFKTNGLYCLRKHLEKHLNGSLKCPSCQFEAWCEEQLTNHKC